jgi:membrane-associated protein
MNFCKLILIFLFVLITSASLNAQNVTLKIVNQYGAKVDDLKLEANGVAMTLTAAKDGTVSFAIPKTDSFTITGKNCAALVIKKEQTSKADFSSKGLEMNKNFTWKDLINPMFYIKYGGLWMLLFIIFAETGLFAGFFLPGDSLLFVAGIFSGPLANEFLKLIGMGGVHNQWLDLLVLIALVSAAGIIGNFVGYWFGRKVGPAMFSWKDNFLFKKKYLIQAQEFYDKNGGGAIVIARFLPIIRTFAPIVAGIVQMPKAKFTYYNIVGCIAWVASMLCIGHFLDKAFPTLKNHLELIIIGIVLITTAPVLYKLFFGKKEKVAA